MLIVIDPIQTLTTAGVSGVAAVAISLRRFRKRFAAIAGIEVNVSAQTPIITFVLDGKCFVATLVQMTAAVVSFGIPVGVTREPVLHPTGEIWLRRSDEGVDMIGHPAIGDHLPPTSRHLLDQSLGEPLVVPLVVKQSASTIAPGDNMIDRIFVLQSWQTGHE